MVTTASLKIKTSLKQNGLFPTLSGIRPFINFRHKTRLGYHTLYRDDYTPLGCIVN